MKTTSLIELSKLNEDYLNSEDIRIDQLDILGKKQVVDLNDLKDFTNIKSLTISSMILSRDDLKKICSTGCTRLELINIEFMNNVEDIINSSNIDHLILKNVKNINISKINKNVSEER